MSSPQEKIPSTMKAIFLEKFNEKLVLKKDIKVPQPNKDEVLIKVIASTIHPSDIFILQGLYKTNKKIPFIAGQEGSGIVVACGQNVSSVKYIGKKVSFVANKSNSGAWAEYAICNTKFCFPHTDDVKFEQAACAIANPFTALIMLDIVKKKNYKCVIQSAASSQVGMMTIRLFQKNNVPIINIVRRQEQVDLLKNQLQADYVLNSSDKNFSKDLFDLCKQLNPTCFFDAIGGSFTAKILHSMPKSSTAYVYGNLSNQNAQIKAGDAIFNKKKIKGFWLTNYFIDKNEKWWQELTKNLSEQIMTCLSSTISEQFHLDSANQAVEFYKQNMQKGKVLIKPSL